MFLAAGGQLKVRSKLRGPSPDCPSERRTGTGTGSVSSELTPLPASIPLHSHLNHLGFGGSAM